jgi:hypothetical protein
MKRQEKALMFRKSRENMPARFESRDDFELKQWAGSGRNAHA